MIILTLTLALAAVCAAQDGLEAGRFRLKEMDLHLHSGMERPVAMDKWLDLAVADGRKVVLLLDHLELYRKKQPEALYPFGPAGHQALFADFDRAAARKDLLIFKGWEVSETELDTGLEMAPLRMADAIGWHISPRNGFDPPNGQTLLKRARQLLELQKQLPAPMILLHPFPMRLENLRRTAVKNGKDPAKIPVSEYRFFRAGEQEELIRLLRGTSVYIEMNRDTEQYFDDPACREALIADILPLARGGLEFMVSTDNHHLRAANKPFTPDAYCRPAGVTEANTNGIVRELLAIRARRSLR